MILFVAVSFAMVLRVATQASTAAKISANASVTTVSGSTAALMTTSISAEPMQFPCGIHCVRIGGEYNCAGGGIFKYCLTPGVTCYVGEPCPSKPKPGPNPNATTPDSVAYASSQQIAAVVSVSSVGAGVIARIMQMGQPLQDEAVFSYSGRAYSASDVQALISGDAEAIKAQDDADYSYPGDGVEILIRVSTDAVGNKTVKLLPAEGSSWGIKLQVVLYPTNNTAAATLLQP